jgi:regulator of protease activity HflC (stomatin/prohibitin superfamily)
MFKESANLLVWLIPVLLLALIVLQQAIRILREYERGVIFRLGKLLGAKGPGMILLIGTPGKIKKAESLGKPHYTAEDGYRAWVIKKP